jgi:hypothetical protein
MHSRTAHKRPRRTQRLRQYRSWIHENSDQTSWPLPFLPELAARTPSITYSVPHVSVSLCEPCRPIRSHILLIHCHRYIFLYPLIILCIKSSRSALQTVLHALFLPTPYKVPLSTDASTQLRDEVLKPGALYAECAVVPPLPIPALPLVEDEKDAKDVDGEKEDAGGMAEDGELGGVRTGTAVWEHFERALKAWEAREPPLEQEEKDEPTVDATPSADS